MYIYIYIYVCMYIYIMNMSMYTGIYVLSNARVSHTCATFFLLNSLCLKQTTLC